MIRFVLLCAIVTLTPGCVLTQEYLDFVDRASREPIGLEGRWPDAVVAARMDADRRLYVAVRFSDGTLEHFETDPGSKELCAGTGDFPMGDGSIAVIPRPVPDGPAAFLGTARNLIVIDEAGGLREFELPKIPPGVTYGSNPWKRVALMPGVVPVAALNLCLDAAALGIFVSPPGWFLAYWLLTRPLF